MVKLLSAFTLHYQAFNLAKQREQQALQFTYKQGEPSQMCLTTSDSLCQKNFNKGLIQSEPQSCFSLSLLLPPKTKGWHQSFQLHLVVENHHLLQEWPALSSLCLHYCGHSKLKITQQLKEPDVGFVRFLDKKIKDKEYQWPNMFSLLLILREETDIKRCGRAQNGVTPGRPSCFWA